MKSSDKPQIIEMTPDDFGKLPLCSHKNAKKEPYRQKFLWLTRRMAEGLKVKMLSTPDDDVFGYIEYNLANAHGEPSTSPTITISTILQNHGCSIKKNPFHARLP